MRPILPRVDVTPDHGVGCKGFDEVLWSDHCDLRMLRQVLMQASDWKSETEEKRKRNALQSAERTWLNSHQESEKVVCGVEHRVHDPRSPTTPKEW